MKKVIMLVLSFIMLISMMIPIASAASTTTVSVSVSSSSNSYSYSYTYSSSSSFSSTTTVSGSFEENRTSCIPWTDVSKNLDPFFERIKELSALHEMHKKMIRDFVTGKWDGTLGPNSSSCYLDNRTYHWGSYNSSTGDWVNDEHINIDYLGSLDVIPGISYSLAVDYDKGIIEQWQLGEMKDSWTLKLNGEKITGVQVSLELEDSTSVGNVLTVDKNERVHFYTLMPNGGIVKEF